METTIINAIGSVGFPIVACCAMGYFCAVLVPKLSESIGNMNLTLVKLSDAIDDLTSEVRGDNK